MKDTVVDTIEYRELLRKAKKFDKIVEISKDVSLESDAFQYTKEDFGQSVLDIVFQFKNNDYV